MLAVMFKNVDKSLFFWRFQRKYATPQKAAFTSFSRNISGRIDSFYSINYFVYRYTGGERGKLQRYLYSPWHHLSGLESRLSIHTARHYLDKSPVDSADSTENSVKNSETNAEKTSETSSNANLDKEAANDVKTKGSSWKLRPISITTCAGLFFAGCGLSYILDKGRHHEDPSKLSEKDGLSKAESLTEKVTQSIVRSIRKMLYTDDEPLLPDYKDLNYPPNLPTLVIDMDKVVVKLEYDRKNGWRVKKRPYADQFFRELVNYYEIVIWSDDSYPVATDIAVRWGLPVIGCIHRNHCKKFQGRYIKDLSRLGRDLKRVVLVDHDRVACMLQEENAVLIKEYDGNEDDTELYYLINLLKTIAINPQDVTMQIKNMGGGLDYELGKRFSEKLAITQEKAKSRMNISKRLGFKHF